MNQFTERNRRRREPREMSPPDTPKQPKQPKQPVYNEAAVSRRQPLVGAPPMSFSGGGSGITREVRQERRITGVPLYADPSQIRNSVKPQTDPGSRKPVFNREGGTYRPEPVAAVPIRKAARRPNTGSDALAANKAKQTEDIWGTKAPKTEPLRPPVSNKTAAQNPPEEYTNPPQNGILEAEPPPQQPVLPAQTTVDTAPISNRAKLIQQGHALPPVLPSAWKPSAQHTPQLTVDTAPVSNRAALFGAEEGEPDLALLAKKLEQLADLYREFTPAQKADVERLYRNDPAGLAVIQGRTTGGDWLKEQRLKRSAEEKTNETLLQQDALEFESDQNERLSDKEKSQRSENVSKQVKGYSFDLDGNIVLNRPERDAESVGRELHQIQRKGYVNEQESWELLGSPPKDRFGKLVFSPDEWKKLPDKLLKDASNNNKDVLWEKVNRQTASKKNLTELLFDLLDSTAMFMGSGVSKEDTFYSFLYKLAAAYTDGIDKPSVGMTVNSRPYTNWTAELDEYAEAVKKSDYRYYVSNGISAIEFAQRQENRLKRIMEQSDFGFDTAEKNEYYKMLLLREIELSIAVNMSEKRGDFDEWKKNR